MSDLFSQDAFDDHEQVLFVSDPSSGMRGIIGIHSTVLGPAAGGCRMYPYGSTDEALEDVLRLSRGMTLKNAAAGLPLGGGKCVILGDPGSSAKEPRLRAMAHHVACLNGMYWTAIDVGVGPADADLMAEECDYIFARASQFADFAPAHFTALGGFEGIRAAATFVRGSDDLEGLRVAVQGVGQTGADVIGQLAARGAVLWAADTNEEALERVVREYGVTPVAPESIHAQEVDVFSPCAMGGVLNDQTIPELGCRAIAGLANNQLRRRENGRQLMERNIAYAPDFIVNAGGMIGCSGPILGTSDDALALEQIRGLYEVTLSILEKARQDGVPSEQIAEAMALERIEQVRAQSP